MLIPQFSLRTTLKVVTVCALFFLVAGQALEGRAWAIGVTVGILSVLAILLVHAGFFGIAKAVSSIVGAEQTPARTSQGGVQLSSDVELLPTDIAPLDRAECSEVEPTKQ